MKKNTHYIALLVILLLITTACKNNSASPEIRNFITYVDSIDKVGHTHKIENWDFINNEYNRKIAMLEQELESMGEDEKAMLEESKIKFAKLKATYDAKIAELNQATTTDEKRQLRDRLFGTGAVSEDMQFNFVTSKNALNIFQTFVETVDANKDAYTKEDWNEIEMLYGALNTRKNAIEKDLSNNDNVKIAGLKVKFASIKALSKLGV